MTMAVTGRTGPDPKIADPAFVEAFINLVREGVPGYLAAESLRLNRATYYLYLRKGGHPAVAESDGWVPPDQAQEPYASFVEQVVAAEALAHIDIIRTVHKKVQNDVNAAIKYMRARWPDDYGRAASPQPPVAAGDDPVIQMSLSDFLEAQRRMRSEREA